MISVGIDAGSRAIKAVLMSTENQTVIASGTVHQGTDSGELATGLFHQLIEEHNLNRADIDAIIATGYGRNQIDIADRAITEITCHAKGVHHLVSNARTVIEIGGQDSKVLRLDDNGSVYDFVMNDRCAAGTGRFLEVIADRLDVNLDRLGEMSAQSTKPASISSTCIVFAETEIIGLMASGITPVDIVAGVQDSIATRISSMVGRNAVSPVVFTGGVALISGMDKALERAIGQPVSVVPTPQMTGAIGAAVIAASSATR